MQDFTYKWLVSGVLQLIFSKHDQLRVTDIVERDTVGHSWTTVDLTANMWYFVQRRNEGCGWAVS